MKNQKKENKKGSAKRGFLIAAVVVLALILVLLIVATVFISGTLSRITRVDDLDETMSQEELESILNETEAEDENFTGIVLNPEDVTMPDVPVERVDGDENLVHVLLVGQDTYSKTSRSRSDSMILCTLNRSAKTLTLTSFMRDLYVRIPGYYSHRMNTAYVLDGFDALYDTIEFNFGLVIEHGVAVNFGSFKEVIDAVGGVEVELTGSEARHLNNQDYSWGLIEGVNHLDGEQALAYSRIRKLDSDFNRTSRQRTVIMALIESAKKQPLTDLYKLVDALIPMVVTDMSNGEIVSLAMEIAPVLSELTVVTQRIPADGEYRSVMIDGMAVLLPDLEGNRQVLVEAFGKP
ncbi:MAG: LCP family protein [Oscillospiraceae bacterium]|nr:LCP family protein [Oscillospiraceae bacterium]